MLLLHPSDEAYGSDRVLLRLVTGLQSRGWRVGVLLSDEQGPGWLTEQLRQQSIDVRRGPMAVARRQDLGLRRLPAHVRDLFRSRRWIRAEAQQFRPSIIHVNTSALLVATVLGRPAQARLVWHVHELVIRPRIASWIFRIAPTLTADRVIAISRAVRDHVSPRGLGRGRVTVVWNGIEERPEAPQRDVDRPVVAFVGRLNRWKGWDVFLDAVGRIASTFPKARFLIAGDAPPGEEWRTAALQDQLARLGLQSRVEALGFERDVPALLDQVAVVVVPSVWPEPFGLVTLEAMRAGCAVIATAHGGSLDLIEAGTTGALVPPGDPTSLAAVIESLLEDPALRARLGGAARRRAQTAFTREAFLDGIEQVYAKSVRRIEGEIGEDPRT